MLFPKVKISLSSELYILWYENSENYEQKSLFKSGLFPSAKISCLLGYQQTSSATHPTTSAAEVIE
jgi:hypothetical protein